MGVDRLTEVAHAGGDVPAGRCEGVGRTAVAGTLVALARDPHKDAARTLADKGIDVLVSTDQAIAAGELEDPNPGTLSQLLGRSSTPLRTALAPEFA